MATSVSWNGFPKQKSHLKTGLPDGMLLLLLPAVDFDRSLESDPSIKSTTISSIESSRLIAALNCKNSNK